MSSISEQPGTSATGAASTATPSAASATASPAPAPAPAPTSPGVDSESDPDDHHAPESEPHESLRHDSGSATRNFFNWIVVLAGVVAACWGIWYGAVLPSIASREEAAKRASASVTRPVNVLQPIPSPALTTLVLPGTIKPWQQTDLFARTNGYLQRWVVDIGDSVTEGQVLAIIETPEVDQELKSAQGDLATAQANFDLASITERRWKELLDGKVSTPQEYDEKAGAKHAREADLAAAKARVSRLQDLQAFQKVTAPFSGIVTARNAQVGALINSGSSPGSVPLFTIAQMSRLRVSVRVPQAYVRSVSVGLDADLLVPEFRGRIFHGKVSRSANALDDATRTLLTEVEVPNPDGALLPGMYANVRFAMRDAQPFLLLPANTLLFRPEGPQVLLVDEHNKVVQRGVKMGRDYGTVVEIVDGLAVTDKVISNPTYELTPGLEVDSRLLPAADLKTAASQINPKSTAEINFKEAAKAPPQELRIPSMAPVQK